MNLTNVHAQRLLGALRTIDMSDSIKLAGQTRLDIARNINRLMPDMQAFERAVAAKRREMQPGEANVAANNEIQAEIENMGAQEFEVKLYKLEYAKLNLDDNPRITGDTIAALAPILKDFDTMTDVAE